MDTAATLDEFLDTVDYEVPQWQRDVLQAVMDGDYRPVVHLNRRADRAAIAHAVTDLVNFIEAQQQPTH